MHCWLLHCVELSLPDCSVVAFCDAVVQAGTACLDIVFPTSTCSVCTGGSHMLIHTSTMVMLCL